MKKLLLVVLIFLGGCTKNEKANIFEYEKDNELLINKQTGETWLYYRYSNMDLPVWVPVGFDRKWHKGLLLMNTNEVDEKKRTTVTVYQNARFASEEIKAIE